MSSSSLSRRGRVRRPCWKVGAARVRATGILLLLVFASYILFDGIDARIDAMGSSDTEQNRTFSLRSSHSHRRLTHCSVSHSWIADNGGCATLCGGAQCEPQGECCSCCGMGCETCDNGCQLPKVMDQCHKCGGTGLNSVGCCPQVPARSGCDNECGSTAKDLGCGCGSPGPDSCGVCGGSGPSGCDNMVCGIFPRFNPSVVFPPFQPQLSCTSRFNLSIICSLF
jgi:hypothetical protein